MCQHSRKPLRISNMWQGQITCNEVLRGQCWEVLGGETQCVYRSYRELSPGQLGIQSRPVWDVIAGASGRAGKVEWSKPTGTQMMLSQAPVLDTELQSARSALLSFGPIFPCSGFSPLFWNGNVCAIPYWNYITSLFFFFILQEHIVTRVSRASNKVLHIGPLNLVETI